MSVLIWWLQAQFLPSHFCEISLNLCPAGHLHSKDPTVLIQFPPWQMPGMAWHSSTSVHTEKVITTHSNTNTYSRQTDLFDAQSKNMTHCRYWVCFPALTSLWSWEWQGQKERDRGMSLAGEGETEAKSVKEAIARVGRGVQKDRAIVRQRVIVVIMYDNWSIWRSKSTGFVL